jgi:FkbM family methyltransferase
MNLSQHDLEYLANQKIELNSVLSFHGKTKSQLSQDVFVLSETGFKRGGYFIEFGATNGVKFSNTHLLEKEFGWTGIVAEPARVWQEDLSSNRNCHIEFDCVWSKTGEALEFNEVDAAELSTIDSFSGSDEHAKTREVGNKYSVTTVSLVDMLKRYDAPKEIDYLSIDTEGSEYEILSAFDFDTYRIKIITCEHNYTPMRSKINELLTSKGYIQKYPYLSLLDDWYVLND